MKILVINCGSSSLKYQLFDMAGETVLAKGLCERIGVDGVIIHQIPGRDKQTIEYELDNHETAFKKVMELLTGAEHGALGSVGEIDAVGHRVAHGGTIPCSVRIDEQVTRAIADLIPLAPLHNTAALTGIEACRKVLGDAIPMVAVFDTSFHQTMPDRVSTYAIPRALREKYGIRKYGFHGTSHRYVAQIAAAQMGRELESLRIVTCHLGNGSSVTAVKNGKSLDTTMGFTPLDGVVMGTRCGSIDPAIVPFLMEKEGLDTAQIDNLLNKQSGLEALSGVGSDMREIIAAANNGDKNANIAVEELCYQVKKYIGAYMAAMGGLDAIVFTAGIGENGWYIREGILEGMEELGIGIDTQVNRQFSGEPLDISAGDARVRAFVIPTNEELVIARDTKAHVF